MDELIGMMLAIIEWLTPKRAKEWMMRQSKTFRTILYIPFFIIAVCLVFLFSCLFAYIFLLIAKALFGHSFSMKDVLDWAEAIMQAS